MAFAAAMGGHSIVVLAKKREFITLGNVRTEVSHDLFIVIFREEECLVPVSGLAQTNPTQSPNHHWQQGTGTDERDYNDKPILHLFQLPHTSI